MAGFKLGIVRLGRACGKVKYALLDERDISLVENYAFETRVDIDRDGNGARIYVYIFDLQRGRSSGHYLHEFVWEKHCGEICAGWRVAHKNYITMDNRMENLILVPDAPPSSTPCIMTEPPGEPSNKSNREQSLYWLAVQQLHLDPFSEHFSEPVKHKFFNCDGEIVENEVLEDGCIYYECHYPPCTNMERHIREFSICGRCQEVRYCGAYCQQQDWPVHKLYCRERRRYQITERPPDR
ncbi:hypothetical protein CHS0354_012850 [Potamilus streckersoni]|uniref:MYND-type domain-containing protein n=1 Tax=Potamilus streckersoni TaxID=2493646 RepID=A0AAE0SW10_9BIVA|nr:hypothetical protein CHS0354_012850 [Potamilus streckersoni]